MIITIKPTDSPEEIRRKTAELKPKRLDAQKYAGRVKWDEDALAYQKRLRDEWD